MKYSESNKPLVCMQTQSTCYKGTSKMKIKGVLWHSTGANNSSIKRYVQPSDNRPVEDTYDKEKWLEVLGVNKYKNDWNHIDRRVGLNCWIGKLADGTVATVQTMPWDYRPWGCGSGAKGSCNDGWIQFEICEDGLTNKEYFDDIYKEACEITAYLCKKFDIDPLGTVEHKGVQVPTILCHNDANKLGFGSNHSDVYNWFPKFDKSMETAREDVAKLMKAEMPAKTEWYRVRKSWADKNSQVGAYKDLENAKKSCDTAGYGYSVFNEAGEAVYSATRPTLKQGAKGDLVKELQTRLNELGHNCGNPDGSFGPKTLAAVKSLQEERGLSTNGVVDLAVWNALYAFEPYKVIINTGALRVRLGPGTSYATRTTVSRNSVYTITYEKDNWGRLKSHAGWISLKYTKRANA